MFLEFPLFYEFTFPFLQLKIAKNDFAKTILNFLSSFDQTHFLSQMIFFAFNPLALILITQTIFYLSRFDYLEAHFIFFHCLTIFQHFPSLFVNFLLFGRDACYH